MQSPQPDPARASRCCGATTAATPCNRQPHIVQVATAFVRTPHGETICADRWPEHVVEQQLILAVAGLAFRMPKLRESSTPRWMKPCRS